MQDKTCRRCNASGLSWKASPTIIPGAVHGSRTWRLVEGDGRPHSCPVAPREPATVATRRPRPKLSLVVG